ncbi:segC homing endonuclease [Escherichia phage JS10]|uniref:SegC homing endonuclease n=1 Tax=Escherichia phage JS10 TaxID=576790 RepID=C4MZP2_9CAUD|nr:homing endonuclease [Escherichia phage JS10]ACL78373.1 segC homing endonuclease [Escherichia phage JS10]
MQDHRYFYLYCITNKLNGMIYVGVHQTDNLEDGYMGSGKALKEAQAELGMDNFDKHIIKFFGTQDECYLAEREIVNKSFAKSSLTYNIKKGGMGGWIVRNGYKHTEATKDKMRISGSGCNNGFYGKKHSEETIKAIAEANSKWERKPNQREKMSKKHSGKNNPMFGTVAPNAITVKYNGEEYTSISSAAKAAGLSTSTFRRRYL